MLRLTLATGAIMVAALETVLDYEHGKFRAHHGVLVLAISKFFHVLGILRSELKEKKE